MAAARLQHSSWISLLTLCLLVSCGPAPPVGPRDGAVGPGMMDRAVSIGPTTVELVSLDLRRSYQTYYLMNYPPDGQLFAQVVVAIEGAEDPVEWGQRNLRLLAAGEERRPVFGRPVTVGEGFEMGAPIPSEFVYEFFFLVPEIDEQLEGVLSIAEVEQVSLPALPPPGSARVSLAGGREEPPPQVLSGQSNEARAEGALVVGGSDNRATATFASIGGGRLNQAQLAYSSIGGGRENRAGGFYAAIGGGYGNEAGGREATVAGGSRNVAAAYYAALGGGIRNQVQASSATVAGGAYNGAEGLYSSVGGGTRNLANGESSVVSGGAGNRAEGQQSSVLGGLANAAAGEYSVSLGGYGNRAEGDYAVTLGGEGNRALADHSLTAGRGAYVEPDHAGALLLADGTDALFASEAPNELAVRATGGVRVVTAVGADGTPVSGVDLPAGGGSWSILSDRDEKEGVEAIDPVEVLAGVGSLEITRWRYRSQDARIRHLGPSAQDFERTFGLGESPHRISAVDADGVALAAIQGLLIELEARDQELAQLEARLDRLESRLVELERGGPATRIARGGRDLSPLLAQAAVLAIGLLLGSLHSGRRRREAREPSGGR